MKKAAAHMLKRQNGGARGAAHPLSKLKRSAFYAK
jgi:hypothetical protein